MVKSTEAALAAISKIAEIDHSGYELRSVLAVAPDALEHASKISAEKRSLPLQGLPILIKDNIEAIGLPGSAGSLALFNTPAQRDSSIVTRLREAGAVIVGATNLSEWANIRSTNSTSGWSAVGGLTANPWIHSRSAGGSSSGSGAAVSAGITQWAIGSETDGSIICPASLNGCVGIKPTVGSIPRDAMVPISSSQDTPGPMAQTVGQAALLLDVLMNKRGHADAAGTPGSLTFGVVKGWITQNEGVNSLFEEVKNSLSRFGITLVEIDLSEPGEMEHDDELHVLLQELVSDLGIYLRERPGAMIRSLKEVVEYNRAHKPKEMAHFQQELFDMALEWGGRNSGYEVKRARNLAWANSLLAQGLQEVDALIGCTYGPAWLSTLGSGDDHSSASWITMPSAIAGTPIGTVPMGLVDGLPVGLGFVTGRNEEINLLRAMSAAEKALDIGVLKPTFIK